MKIIKYILFLFIFISLVGCTTNETYSTDGFVYNLINDGTSYAIVGFSKDYYFRKIPDSYNGLPITELRTSALQGSSMKKLYIGKNIEIMGWYVFSDCENLKAIEVDNDNKYFKSKDGILYNYDLTELILFPSSLEKKSFEVPSSVNSLGYFAFENNKYLEEVTLNENITIIEGSCFYKAQNLKTIKGISNVIEITRNSFFGCSKLENIELPLSLTTIGSYAFSDCISLKEIKISKNVISIGKNAFYNCSSLTISCEVSKRPDTWNKEWNGYTKTLWNQTL